MGICRELVVGSLGSGKTVILSSIGGPSCVTGLEFMT